MRVHAVHGLVSDLGDHSSASHELCKETEAHLLHIVTKHKFGIETGDIHIFLNNLFY